MTRIIAPFLIGFTLWSAAFVGLYAVQGLGCHWGWGPGLHRGVLTAGYLLTLAIIGWVIHWQLARRSYPSTMVQRVGVMLSICALIASAVIFAPSLYASLCI